MEGKIRKVVIGKYDIEYTLSSVTSWCILGLAALGFGCFVLS